jgi:hypothetical protein
MMVRNRNKKAGKIEITGENDHQKSSNYLNFLLVAWFLESCALGPNLISQFILPPVVRVLFSITSVLVLISLPGRIKLKKQKSVANSLILGGLLIYNIGLIFSFQDIKTIDQLIGRLLITVTLFIAYTCMEEDVFVKCMDAYCKFMMLFAVSAIIVSAVVLILHLPPINEFVAPEGRVYQNYAIAFVEAEVDTLSGFKRAGSFYDEPGTFAVFLIPALFWTMLVRPSTAIFLSLFTALILTFSVGGWMSFGVSLLYAIKLYPDVIKKYQTTIIAVFFTFGVLGCLNILLTFFDLGWLSAYFDYKFTGSGAADNVSSVGTRQNEIEQFFSTLGENPGGYGIKSPKIPIFSVGLLASSIEAGLLGVIGYSMTVLGMVGILLKGTLTPHKQSRAVVAILGSNLSMLIMSTQRIDSLAFYTGIFMLSFLMNCSLAEQVQPIIAEIESAVIPEDEKFQDSAIVTALKESKLGKTISQLYEKSKASPVGKTISQLYDTSKKSRVAKTISQLYDTSKKSKVAKTISKLYVASTESKVSKTISKLFTPNKASNSKRSKQSPRPLKNGELKGEAELKDVLKDLFDDKK